VANAGFEARVVQVGGKKIIHPQKKKKYQERCNDLFFFMFQQFYTMTAVTNLLPWLSIFKLQDCYAN